jgi:P pilus assembly chaperone PapD
MGRQGIVMPQIQRFSTTALMAVLLLSSATSVADAAGMVPQTPILILEESTGEASINITNTEPLPALLHTSIENVPEDTELLLLLTPPVARVESGGTQLVRFILRSAEPLQTERLKRVIFEGIQPLEKGSNARVSLTVKQNIPAILRPKNLPIERQPWTLLKWSVQDTQLQVSNPSPYVVRLANTVNLLPGEAPVDLGRSYILPGEKLRLTSASPLPATATQVRLYPATMYGFAAGNFDAPLVTGE